MHVPVWLCPRALGASAHQGGVAAARGLADVHEEPQARHLAQNRMVMGRLMRIAPAPAFQIWAPAFHQPQQRLIQRNAGNVGAGFHRRRLDHITPDRSPIDVLVNPLQKHGLGMGKAIGQRPNLIACQPVLQDAQPRFGD